MTSSCNSWLPSRRRLFLNGVVLSEIENTTFAGFLHAISLINCGMTRIDKDTFTQLRGVQLITVKYNQVHHLDANAFSGLNNFFQSAYLAPEPPRVTHELLAFTKEHDIETNYFFWLTNSMQIVVDTNIRFIIAYPFANKVQWQWYYRPLATRFAAYPGCRWAHLTKRSTFYVD